jgi:hypothetical protein
MAKKFRAMRFVRGSFGTVGAPKQVAATTKADDRQPVGDPAERPLWLQPQKPTRRTLAGWLKHWGLSAAAAEAPAPGDLGEALRKQQTPRAQAISDGLSRGRSPIAPAPAQPVAPGTHAPPDLAESIRKSRKGK